MAFSNHLPNLRWFNLLKCQQRIFLRLRPQTTNVSTHFLNLRQSVRNETSSLRNFIRQYSHEGVKSSDDADEPNAEDNMKSEVIAPAERQRELGAIAATTGTIGDNSDFVEMNEAEIDTEVPHSLNLSEVEHAPQAQAVVSTEIEGKMQQGSELSELLEMSNDEHSDTEVTLTPNTDKQMIEDDDGLMHAQDAIDEIAEDETDDLKE